jgi:trehalose-6-phosphate synthase
MQSCTRVLGLETQASTVFVGDRAVPVGVFPVGIDPDKFLANFSNPTVVYAPHLFL